MRKLLTFLILGFLVLVDYNLVQGTFDSRLKLGQVKQEDLKLADLQRKNFDLKQELKEKDSSFFIEKEARNRLDLGKPGEKVIIVPSSLAAENTNPKPTEKKTNWEKWLALLTSNSKD